MATTKEELLVSGMRHAVVTRYRGTSVVRSLKLVHPPHFSTITRNNNNNNQTPYCNHSYLAGETNTDQWLNTQSTTDQLGYRQKRQSRVGVPIRLAKYYN